MCDRCASPLEKQFHEAWNKNTAKGKPQLVPQYVIDNHRVDFAIPDYNIVVELDSKQYHSSEEAKYNDRERDNILRSKGWKLIHLYGPDVHWHPNSSVEMTVFMIANMFDQYVPARKLIPNGEDLQKQERPYDRLTYLLLKVFHSGAIIVLFSDLVSDFISNKPAIHSIGDEEIFILSLLIVLVLPYIVKWWIIIRNHS